MHTHPVVEDLICEVGRMGYKADSKSPIDDVKGCSPKS